MTAVIVATIALMLTLLPPVPQLYLPIILRAPAPTPTPTPTPQPLYISTISYAGGDEYIAITNRGATVQLLTAWRIVSHDGTTPGCPVEPDQTYTFPTSYTLAPGATVRIHSGPSATSNPPTDLLWATKRMWNDDGDIGDLRNPTNALIHSYVYGACR